MKARKIKVHTIDHLEFLMILMNVILNVCISDVILNVCIRNCQYNINSKVENIKESRESKASTLTQSKILIKSVSINSDKFYVP
jgi:hypothetical protein